MEIYTIPNAETTRGPCTVAQQCDLGSIELLDIYCINATSEFVTALISSWEYVELSSRLGVP